MTPFIFTRPDLAASPTASTELMAAPIEFRSVPAAPFETAKAADPMLGRCFSFAAFFLSRRAASALWDEAERVAPEGLCQGRRPPNF